MTSFTDPTNPFGRERGRMNPLVATLGDAGGRAGVPTQSVRQADGQVLSTSLPGRPLGRRHSSGALTARPSLSSENFLNDSKKTGSALRRVPEPPSTQLQRFNDMQVKLTVDRVQRPNTSRSVLDSPTTRVSHREDNYGFSRKRFVAGGRVDHDIFRHDIPLQVPRSTGDEHVDNLRYLKQEHFSQRRQIKALQEGGTYDGIGQARTLHGA